MIQIGAIAGPPFEADPTWWIDLTETDNPHTFQVFIPLETHDTSDSVREKIKGQLQGRRFFITPAAS